MYSGSKPTSEIRNSDTRCALSLEMLSTSGFLDTAMPTSASDHRNVFFKNSTIAVTFSSLWNART
uniref:Uncharacterized protein n=1 Tax=Arundo donax TaxID=35708 RepID=A0A0A9BU43_ARUDO